MATPDASILIISQEPLLRLGVRQFMIQEAGLKCCGEATSSGEALDLQGRFQPCLVVVATCLASGEAPRLVRDLRRARPDQRVLVVGRATEPDLVRRVLQAGARGYVSSLDEVTELRLAVASVLGGHLHVSRSVADCMTMGPVTKPATGPDQQALLRHLSDRELEVFQLIGRKLGCKEIAANLSISVKTVETHKQRMKDKLGLQHGAELQRLALAEVERQAQTGAA